MATQKPVKKPVKKKAAKAKPKRKASAASKPKAPTRKPSGGTVGAPLGNQSWRMRSSHGRKPMFATGEALWDACVEYFEWVEATPLKEQKLFTYMGEIVKGEVSKMRAMTQNGLCTFLDISVQTWNNFRRRDELSETVDRVDRIIYDYKFTGAAADMLNVNIIARELGLRDGMEHTGKDGGPISGVLAIPTSPDDWATIAKAHQNALKQDDSE